MHRKIDVYRRALACDFAGHDDWLAAGQTAGYTGHRDLAGFFGGPVPSMVGLPDGRRRITPAGRRRARRLGLWTRPSGAGPAGLRRYRVLTILALLTGTGSAFAAW
jgi:hypothetical protein